MPIQRASPLLVLGSVEAVGEDRIRIALERADVRSGHKAARESWPTLVRGRIEDVVPIIDRGAVRQRLVRSCRAASIRERPEFRIGRDDETE